MPFDPGTGFIAASTLQPGLNATEFQNFSFILNPGIGVSIISQIFLAASQFNTIVLLQGSVYQEVTLAEGLAKLMIPTLNIVAVGNNVPLEVTAHQILETPTFWRSFLSFSLPVSVITPSLPINWTLNFKTLDGTLLNVARTLSGQLSGAVTSTS